MRLFTHLHFEEGSDDWFFGPLIARFFGGDAPFTMTEHSRREGDWELEGLLKAHAEATVLRRCDAVDAKSGTFSITRLVLRTNEDCFIVWDAPRMYVLATESQRARNVMDELVNDFFKPKRHHNKAVFNVICQQYGETASTSVPVKRPFLRKLEDFALHYGDSFVAFHKSLAARMKRLSQGVAVLRGEPGTGKTTYIRALMWQLRRTHRFYTIPLQEFTRMTASDLTSFWLGEKKEHEKQTIVMVILGEKTRRQLIEFKGTSENLAHWPESTAKPRSAKPKIDIQANGLPVVRCGTNQNPLQSPRRQNPSGTFRPPNPLA